ncbi:MAG: alanine racemase, partial [Cyanobacteria bacterium REEB65]|nr:alanine racemase [Cyanobacteria bacterium REEB65]
MLDPTLTADDPSLATLRGARVVIDLVAIARNVRALRAWLSPHTHLLAVVKADGYGHGALAVAQTAISAGADWIGVATVAEGIRLRQAGIRNPLLLLSLAQYGAYETALANDLHLTVSSAEALERAARIAGGMGVTTKIHLKVDTGMTRVGVPLEDAAALVEMANRLDALQLVGLSTHLAMAEASGDGTTDLQLGRFQDAVVSSPLPPGILRHAANSAATLYHPRSHWDMVRPGLMIYGVAPDPARPMPFELHPALSVRARIAQVRDVPA